MIRGALVFAAGLVFGYAKAVSETEAINKVVHDVVEKAKKAWDEADQPTDVEADQPDKPDVTYNRMTQGETPQ